MSQQLLADLSVELGEVIPEKHVTSIFQDIVNLR